MSNIALPDLLAAAARIHGQPDKPASGRSLADTARADGYPVSHATLNRILAGTYRGRPNNETLDAIAHLAQVSRSAAYEAAKLPAPIAPLADEIPSSADSLPTRERQLVVELVRVLAARHQEDELRGKTEFEDLSTILDSSGVLIEGIQQVSGLIGEEARKPEAQISIVLAEQLLTATDKMLQALLPLTRATNRMLEDLTNFTENVVSRRSELPELASKVAEASHIITAIEMDLPDQPERREDPLGRKLAGRDDLGQRSHDGTLGI